MLRLGGDGLRRPVHRRRPRRRCSRSPSERALQLRAAALTALLALVFDLLFFFVDELPATVPVALALVVVDAQPPREIRSRAGDLPLRVVTSGGLAGSGSLAELRPRA